MMSYSTSALFTLALQCAPTVAPETVIAIIRTESSGQSLALHVNGAKQPKPQNNAADAAAVARRFIAAGYSVDLGLGQINSRNMRWLGLTWENVFDPCKNIHALGAVLTSNYNAAKSGRDPQVALRVALSMYNTGSQTRGFRNGYVAKVVRNAGISSVSTYSLPETSLAADPEVSSPSIPAFEDTRPRKKASAPIGIQPPPTWNVFERAAYERETTHLIEIERGRI
jgi:type IV secretion system protein VirB1